MRDRTETLLNLVLRRAATQPRFRTRLLAAPEEALRDELGIDVPRDFRIRFIEREPGVNALIVLPDPAPGHAPIPFPGAFMRNATTSPPAAGAPAASDWDSHGLLDDDELEAVVGGLARMLPPSHVSSHPAAGVPG